MNYSGVSFKTHLQILNVSETRCLFLPVLVIMNSTNLTYFLQVLEDTCHICEMKIGPSVI